ncbi:hypothetical protein DF033_33955 [Burkholderia cenocepacia]|nr:hypothetical protein DF033_33955 [Burkholderia cenocepacia]
MRFEQRAEVATRPLLTVAELISTVFKMMDLKRKKVGTRELLFIGLDYRRQDGRVLVRHARAGCWLGVQFGGLKAIFW